MYPSTDGNADTKLMDRYDHAHQGVGEGMTGILYGFCKDGRLYHVLSKSGTPIELERVCQRFINNRVQTASSAMSQSSRTTMQHSGKTTWEHFNPGQSVKKLNLDGGDKSTWIL